MWLAYLDESYDKTHHWIAALVVEGGDARSLGDDLDELVRVTADIYGIPRTAEMHGHDIMWGKKDWGPFNGKLRAAIGFYRDALKVISNHDVRIIIKGVYLPTMIAKDQAHRRCLEYLLEEIHSQAKKHDQYALVICDEVAKQDTYRRHLKVYQQVSTGGYTPTKLDRIVDTLHFAPSHRSRLLQGADLIVYLQRRLSSLKGQDSGDERGHKAAEAMWAIVKPRVTYRHCWRPS